MLINSPLLALLVVFIYLFFTALSLVVPVAASLYIRYRIIKKIPEGQTTSDELTKREKIATWLACLTNPIVSGAILYYSLRKRAPIKAKRANHISMWVFLIFLILSLPSIIFTINSIMKQMAPVDNQVSQNFSATTSVVSNIETSDWKTYQNDDYGFNIKYPQDYIVSDLRSIPGGSYSDHRDFSVVKLTQLDKKCSVEESEEAPISIYFRKIGDKNSYDLQKELYNDKESWAHNRGLREEFKKEIINGEEVNQYVIYSQDSMVQGVETYFINKNNDIVISKSLFCEKTNTGLAQVYDQMLKTVKVD